MNYRITEQYSRDEEKLIAEFHELNDASIFIKEKLSNDDEKRMERIYRLYNDVLLTQEFNPGNLSVASAQYAEGNGDVSESTQFSCGVMFQVENNSDKTNLANFNDREDAFLFILGKCKTDELINDHDLFFIVKNKIVIDTLSKIMVFNRKREFLGAGDSHKGVIFYPHPMQTTLKPPGFPKDNWLEEKDESKK